MINQSNKRNQITKDYEGFEYEDQVERYHNFDDEFEDDDLDEEE